eukprot:5841875-Pleurochrysis_carterae.AAC.1
MSPSRSPSLPIGLAATVPSSRTMRKSHRRLGEWSRPLTIPPCSGVLLAAPRSLAMVCAWSDWA